MANTRVPDAETIVPPDESLDPESSGGLVGGSVQEAFKSETEIGPSSTTELKITNGLMAHKTLADVCPPVGLRNGRSPE